MTHGDDQELAARVDAATEPAHSERDDEGHEGTRNLPTFWRPRSPLILSGMTMLAKIPLGPLSKPQRSPLILSGMTRSSQLRAAPVRPASAPQRSPLILSGMTGGPGGPAEREGQAARGPAHFEA